MTAPTTLHIGGVPEHFNYPWYLALRDKAFLSEGVNLRWKDFYAGTGAMCQALRSGEIDLAVLLTEGIVRDIIQGNPSLILQVFVASPLRWGIHVAAGSEYTDIASIRGSRAAISRYGSGSHLMAYVLAENNGWSVEDELRFEVIENIDGALAALPQGNADYFLWEKFTTKPYVDNGIFRCIGESPTPWPCFVIAVRKESWEQHPNKIRRVLEVINSYTVGFKQIQGIDNQLAQRYGLEASDVSDWLEVTEWGSEQLNTEQLSKVQQKLLQLGLIEAIGSPELFFPKK